MNRSLTVRLIFLIIFTMMIGSLLTIVLVNTFTANQFRGFAEQRDRNVAATMADYLTAAALQGRLEEAIGSIAVQPRMESDKMGMHHMRGNPSRREQFREEALPGRLPSNAGEIQPLMFRDEEGFIPLVITDPSGRVLRGVYRDRDNRIRADVPSKVYSQGAIYYRDGGSAGGYVLAGSMIGGIHPENETRYMKSLFLGILFSSLVAALLASLIGAAVLRSLLRPLRDLNGAVRQLSRGDYSIRVDVPASRDEMALLASGFNEMADSLNASEEWKKQIISDTAHELRTPVSLIMGNLEMMLEGVYTPDEARLRSLYEESTALAELIRELQELASAEAALIRLVREPFSPAGLIRKTAEDFRPLAEEKGLSLSAECRFEGEWTGDRLKILQVLKNLTANALKFTPAGGHIVLRVRKEADRLILEVEDNGPGIPGSEKERIFDRFYRVEKSRNRGRGGSGLGLAISRAIVELHGGRITAEDGREGGTLFRVSLPMLRPE